MNTIAMNAPTPTMLMMNVRRARSSEEYAFPISEVSPVYLESVLM